ncbi:hypothetical protein NQ318_016261 [Aromia moschata]|uniref:Retrotransposon gag domain-containing protein n=1 Tax=Aromia moschata TaxID=1265417 RepID=A0AAV8Y0P3_9CUCU|nr:hypothetical protein NQ318_016261 [Aromia moschata]
MLKGCCKEQQNDYDRIIGALEIRYGHKYLCQVYQSQIKSRQQRSNESLQEYEADIERLIHLAYPQAPKEFLEQIGIQTFINGLVDTEMQQALRLGRHTTISDALVAALEFKAAKEASRSYKSREMTWKTRLPWPTGILENFFNIRIVFSDIETPEKTFWFNFQGNFEENLLMTLITRTSRSPGTLYGFSDIIFVISDPENPRMSVADHRVELVEEDD